MLSPTKRINAKEYEANQIQENLARSLDRIAEIVILDGLVLKNVPIGTSSTAVNHGLGRIPEGYVITGKTGLGDIYSTARDSKTLTLISSVTVFCDLWIY